MPDVELIPVEFASLLRCKLGSLVGKDILEHALVSLDFWLNMPKKIQQMAHYDERVRKRKSDGALVASSSSSSSFYPPVVKIVKNDK